MGSLVSSSANTQDGQKRLVANKPVEVALNEIVTRARVFTDAGGAAIALRDGDYLITRASSGNIAPDVGARNAVEGSLTGQAVLKGVPIHIEDSDKDPRVDAEICRQLNTRSFIVTPIAGSTSMLGVLAVFASTPNAFTRTDLAVLRTMADQIATALGGGAFMQQLWPSENAAGDVAEAAAPPVQYEPEPVKQAPEPPKFQSRVETPKYEPPRQEPPRREAPKAEPVRQKPAVADTHFASPAEPDTDVLESEPIVMPEKVRPREVAQAKPSASVVERAKPAPIPRVEPQPPQEEIEPIAQPPEQPKVAAKPITAARPIPVKTPAPTPVAKKEPPRPQVKEQPVTGRMKTKPEEDVAVDDEVDTRAARRERERAAVAAKADTAVESRKEVEWKGFGAEQETESRPMGKIIIGAVAALVVVGVVVGVIMMKKSPSKPTNTASTPAATAPAPTTSASATTPGAPAATTTPSTAAQPSKPATTAPATTAPATTAATAPAARPAQPALVIAPGSAPRQTPAVEDAAPPQLAFGGSAPQLPGTNAALPKRASSDPIPAQVIRKVSPAYPEMARRLRQKGSVELQAEVKKDGTVGKVDVISGPQLLRQAAVDALKQWRYRPAQLSGTAVDSTVKVVVNFDAVQ